MDMYTDIPGPPKEPKIMAQCLKTESIGSIGSIILAILEVQVDTDMDIAIDRLTVGMQVFLFCPL